MSRINLRIRRGRSVSQPSFGSFASSGDHDNLNPGSANGGGGGTKIVKVNLYLTSFFRASTVIDEDRAKPILYIVSYAVAVFVDPFFLYIPFLSHTKMCLGMNTKLWKVAVAFRTVTDFFTALTLIMSTDRPQLNRCMSSIKSILLICVKFLVLAPIPQILFSEKFILKTLGGYTFWNLILFCHYGARLVQIYLLGEQLRTRVSVRTLARFNVSVYLFLYLIISHVIGTFWYFLSIQQQVSCWNYACKIDTGCIIHCDGTNPSSLNSTLVNKFCPLNHQKFGIYLDALQSGIVEDKGVLTKFLQCFFWGLRNLSSFASNLHTSANDGETLFAIIISVVALILLIYIIGNIQRYAGLENARLESIVGKMKPIKQQIECLVEFHNIDNRSKKLILEHIQEAFENGKKSFNFEWLRINHFLNDFTKTVSVFKDLRVLAEWAFTVQPDNQPDNQGKAKKWLLDNNIRHDQNNIFFYLTCRLKEHEDVNLISVLSVLPDESKWKTMKDLCFDTLKKVPGLHDIDEEWFIRMSRVLTPVIYPKDSCIFQQGKPLDFIIFITNGIAKSYTSSPDAGGRVSVSCNLLQKGDFFGKEVIQWKFNKGGQADSFSGFPTSTADVKSDTQVEAFVFKIIDLHFQYMPVIRRRTEPDISKPSGRGQGHFKVI